MRTLAPAAALALAMTTVSSVGTGQNVTAKPQAPLNPRSVELVASARNEAAAGRVDAANDLLETALAVEPRNRPAYLLLAELAQRQGLSGKAIRLYREALVLDPNDRAALAGQGEALVAKGAVTRAKENLARLTTLCRATCPEQVALSAAINRGPPPVPAPPPAKP